MSQVVFENDGSIDPRAIKTFGVSAKEKEDPIGFFGTGLKYAIAIFLREGLTVELYTDGKKFLFEKRAIEMRGKAFEVITMNGEELPFTTHLGTNWKLWMAFREFYCNCLDEDGHIYIDDSPCFRIEEDKTRFVVSGSGVVDLFNTKDQIVLSLPDKLKISSGAVDIFNHPSKSLYYRKIRVMDYDKPSLYTYNLTEQTELTEDRTLRNSDQAMSLVSRCISSMTDKHAIRRILTAPDAFMENELSFSNIFFWDENVSPEFLEILDEEYRLNNDKLNKSAKEYQKRRLNKMASKHYQPTPLTLVEKKQLDRASEIISKIWPDFTDYKIMTVKTLGIETMALADTLERTIVLSRKSFEMGTKFLTSTLIEEYMHLKTGHTDFSRGLQTHLFDTLCTMIENHVIGEPI